MTRAGVERTERRRRIGIARAVAAEGGNAKIFADRAGLRPDTAANWLRRNAPDLHRDLTRQGRGPRADSHRALVKLLLLKSVEGFYGGQARLARALGVSESAISKFRASWAPDGLDAAIADLMPDDAEAAHG